MSTETSFQGLCQITNGKLVCLSPIQTPLQSHSWIYKSIDQPTNLPFMSGPTVNPPVMLPWMHIQRTYWWAMMNILYGIRMYQWFQSILIVHSNHLSHSEDRFLAGDPPFSAWNKDPRLVSGAVHRLIWKSTQDLSMIQETSSRDRREPHKLPWNVWRWP